MGARLVVSAKWLVGVPVPTNGSRRQPNAKKTPTKRKPNARQCATQMLGKWFAPPAIGAIQFASADRPGTWFPGSPAKRLAALPVRPRRRSSDHRLTLPGRTPLVGAYGYDTESWPILLCSKGLRVGGET